MSQTLFTTQVPASPDLFDNQAYTLGTLFTCAKDATVSGVRWYFPATALGGTAVGVLYAWGSDSTGTELARASFPAIPTPGAWNTATFASPVAITAGTKYVAAVWTPGRYVATGGFFATALVSGDLTGPADGSGTRNGKFHEGGSGPIYPEGSFNSGGYFADPLVDVTSTRDDVATGTAVETWTAQPVGVWLTAGTAADDWTAGGAIPAPVVGTVEETTSAQPVGVWLAAGTAADTWTAGAIVPVEIAPPADAVATGTAVETWAAQPIGVWLGVGTAVETWAAQPITAPVPADPGDPGVRLADLLPDRMLAALVRTTVGVPGGTRQPADVLAVLGPGNGVSAGYWIARETPGSGDVDDRFAQAVAFQVDAWCRHDDPAQARAGARRLCTLVLSALRAAQRRAAVTDWGHIGYLRVDAWPAEIPEVDRPASLSRYTAAGSLIVRPPR